MAKENRRLTKEERVAQLERLGAPKSIIDEERKSQYASQPIYEDTQEGLDKTFDDAHLTSKLVQTFAVGDGLLLKVYRYQTFPGQQHAQMRLDIVDPTGKIHRGAICNYEEGYMHNNDFVVGITGDKVTADDIYIKTIYAYNIVEVK
jgi:hypothetical protein